ncbi:hypothetical protein MHUMG1_08335 [Metarhizium humberi]|uniref:FAM96B-like protein n=5 Tax=Opisthokonta TaxID=33154 RepID=A0A9P8M5Q0_9HYPO|nr:FAM96B protein [Metarhizium robertsii ARSEF 23]EFY95530.1 FAM96B protein [Metarhizium robertsii ARSEF 23]EXU98732.1 DUF59 domain protein [Metarhizium robertsii]KAH0594012.1 hypothetical protein MHUMG1_08335 [Metarhizium humberi]KID84783.1 FAM96B-like protein [Metarhizium guizhouense ARSEF 977]
MAPAALDNANPTILSASQLPTRQKKPAHRHGPDSRYSDIILSKPAFLSQPCCDDGVAWPRGDDAVNHDQYAPEPIDEQEIYDLIATISDPEHPVSLGQLSIVNIDDIHITPSPALGVPDANTIVQVTVEITPTVTHCSLATVLGLGVRVRLEQCLPPNYRVDVLCRENTHSQDDQVNKQLADKERVAAALENDSLKGVLDKMLETCV